jgi:hypothetical protein
MMNRTLSGNPVRFEFPDKPPQSVRHPVRLCPVHRASGCPVRCPVHEPDGHTHTKSVSCPVGVSGWTEGGRGRGCDAIPRHRSPSRIFLLTGWEGSKPVPSPLARARDPLPTYDRTCADLPLRSTAFRLVSSDVPPGCIRGAGAGRSFLSTIAADHSHHFLMLTGNIPGPSR